MALLLTPNAQALLSGSVKHVYALLQWRANHGLSVVTGWDLYR
jgi:hypothetical protein